MSPERRLETPTFSCCEPLEEEYTCEKCAFRTQFKALLKNHSTFFHQHRFDTKNNILRDYSCKKCRNFRTNSLLLLARHFAACDRPAPTAKKWLQCAQCPYKTPRSSNLKQHQISRHCRKEDIKWHECDKCAFASKLSASLRRHVLYKHTSAEEIEWFECGQCPVRFKCKGDLARHVDVVHGARGGLGCDECGFKTTHSEYLRRHKRRKHADEQEIKWHECGHCRYRTKFRADLVLHVEVKHTEKGEGEFIKCDKCPYRAKVKSYLKKHERSAHAGNKWGLVAK